MSKNEKKKPLSLEETMKLFGARPVGELGSPSPDPLGLQLFASEIAQRFASQRGRPTDRSWTLIRKVPMKQSTWDSLNATAQSLKANGVVAAAGQIAAIALECGLRQIDRESLRSKVSEGVQRARRPIPEQTRAEARRICPAVREHGLW